MIECSNPLVTRKGATLMNGLCFAGTAGINRLRVGMQHDYQQQAMNKSRPGNGGRRR